MSDINYVSVYWLPLDQRLVVGYRISPLSHESMCTIGLN